MHATEKTNVPLRIKFLYRGRATGCDRLWLRQFPGETSQWDSCLFIFDKECKEYDWLVVYDDLPSIQSERFSKRREPLRCNPRNTLLVTSEPSTIKVYGSKYINQFGHILTTHEPWVIKHEHAVYSQCGYRWFYGIGDERIKNFDEMAKKIPDKKNELISTVCSDKKQKSTVHRRRYEFTQKLKKAIPELNIFGHGVRPLDDKADAIDPFKYHVVIENFSGKDHWSEKLADAFLGHSLPLYYGCTNIYDYFPEGSLLLIDPSDEKRSIEIIRNAIQDGEYEKRLDDIKEARRLVLEEYNFFAVVAAIVQERHIATSNDTEIRQDAEIIRSRRAMRNANPWNFITYFFERYSIKLKHLNSK
jgi:hypothetical protein